MTDYNTVCLERIRYTDINLIIISFTSYSNRVEDTAYRAACTLLDQTLPADKVILWCKNPTLQLRNLVGLEIREPIQDIGSHNKIIWTLQEFPNDIIVTADDDLYYPRNWLALLVQEHEKHNTNIICHLAREVTLVDNNHLKPYHQWYKPHHGPNRILPLMGYGCLFPPNSLHTDVTNKELLLRLTPKSNDVWCWAMSVLNRTKHSVVSEQVTFFDIPHNGERLWQYHQDGGSVTNKDRQFQQVIAHYPEILTKMVEMTD